MRLPRAGPATLCVFRDGVSRARFPASIRDARRAPSSRRYTGVMVAATSLIHFDGDRLNVPRTAFEHDGFRAWLLSDEYPDGVRATYVMGEVFFEMSPESIETHSK